MKKVLGILIVFFSVVFLISCRTDNGNAKAKVQDILDEISLSVSEGEDQRNVKSNFNLQEEVLTYNIQWQSSNENIISVTNYIALVSRVDTNKDVTLKAVIEFEGRRHYRDFDLVVIKLDEVPVVEYRVSFYLDSSMLELHTEQTVVEKTKLTRIVNPVKEGYTFVGWFIKDSETRFNVNINILSNYILIAKWEVEVLEDVTYKEDFEDLKGIKDSGGNFSSYEDFYYTSNLELDVTNGRIDIGMKKGEHAITIGGFGNDLGVAGLGRIETIGMTEGISYLEFDARLPYSPESTYPQVNGKDKAANVKVSIMINGNKVKEFKFADDKQANKGTKFILDGLNIIGSYVLSIDVSSGHRLTVDNIHIKTNKNGVEEQREFTMFDFESNFEKFKYDTSPTVRTFNDIEFIMKEVQVEIMHGEKEIPFMSEANGANVARFRGLGNPKDPFSSEIAYMESVNTFAEITTITLDARLFGSDEFYSLDSKINVYYQEFDSEEWVLNKSINLSKIFTNYEFNINKENVKIKIEVTDGSVNIDNLKFSF